MPRQIPDCPTDIPIPKRRESRSYEIELITPMVGGGAVAGEVDFDFPIRPTAIRGHLRYWWRLIRGHSLGEGRWRREEEIFGSTEFPSPIEIRISNWSKPELFPASHFDRFGPESFALFSEVKANLNTSCTQNEKPDVNLSEDISVLNRNESTSRLQRHSLNLNRYRLSSSTMIQASDNDRRSVQRVWKV